MVLYKLIIWNFNINIINKTALHLAVEKGNTEIVQMLLSNKRVNINSETILISIILTSFQIFWFLISF